MTDWELLKNSLWYSRSQWYQFLTKWCGDRDFVREFGFPYRRLCSNVMQLHKQIMFFGYQKQNHCYITNFSYIRTEVSHTGRQKPKYDTAIIDKLYFEVDMHDDMTLVDVFEDAKTLYDIIEADMIFFTGGRGFHIYRSIRDNQLDPKEFRVICKKIESKAKSKGVRSLDCGHLGDIARIYRIPYTIHAKTGRFCIPVSIDEELDDIIARSEGMNVPDYNVVKW